MQNYSGIQLPVSQLPNTEFTSVADTLVQLKGTLIASMDPLVATSIPINTNSNDSDRCWMDTINVTMTRKTTGGTIRNVHPAISVGSPAGAAVWVGTPDVSTSVASQNWTYSWPTGLLSTPSAPLVLWMWANDVTVAYPYEASGIVQVRRQREIPSVGSSTR